jgi:hypothetical protein
VVKRRERERERETGVERESVVKRNERREEGATLT